MKKGIYILLALLAMSICAFAQKRSESNIIHLTKAEFVKKVGNIDGKEFRYTGKKPAIVDFYADWCGPCRKLSPVLEEIAAELKGKVYIYKVNVDKEPAIANAFNIEALPTLVFLPKKGEPVAVRGFRSKESILEKINAILLKKK